MIIIVLFTDDFTNKKNKKSQTITQVVNKPQVKKNKNEKKNELSASFWSADYLFLSF